MAVAKNRPLQSRNLYFIQGHNTIPSKKKPYAVRYARLLFILPVLPETKPLQAPDQFMDDFFRF